ncbi:MAG: hypothetical protein CO189_00905 [candidate division Zixibacteria bacterium CG_4_9_14_3_um_filter_46_8]|nr:MAG: hypothetical protein CO189_00905 [candidate division Zixibacteria bacterium CG_4_9_14_3_um_filter_46_8]
MAKKFPETFLCSLCGVTKPMGDGRSAQLVHGAVGELIRRQHPDWDSEHIICSSCLNQFRTEYVENALESQRGELSAIEDAVIDSLKEQALLSRDTAAEFETTLTFGNRIADRVAEFGGSWRFIIIFGVVMTVWIGINTIVLWSRPFDPYPFILLNLILSCLAAMQAPIIMMSQNRQEAKDRLRSEHDYQINLKAEIEIRQLHIKLDQLINHSWQRLLEIQQVQIELIGDLARYQAEKRQGEQ